MHNSFLSVLFKASQTIALPKSGWERARPVQRFREVQLPTDTGTRTSNSVDTIFSVILFADDVLSTVKMRMIPTSAPFSLTLTQFITTRVWCFRFLVFQIRGSFPSLSGNQMFSFSANICQRERLPFLFPVVCAAFHSGQDLTILVLLLPSWLSERDKHDKYLTVLTGTCVTWK